MEDASVLFCNIVGFDWAAIIQTITGVCAVTIAALALKTWKKQSLAEKKSALLDELCESVNEYITNMSPPIEMVKYIKMQIDSYSSVDSTGKGVINYIENHGNADAERTNSYLEKCIPSITRIRSLVTKAQVFDFINYSECSSSCRAIIHQHRKIEALSTIINQQQMYWENPEVTNALEKVLTVDNEEIVKTMKSENVRYLTFVKSNYEAIYK